MNTVRSIPPRRGHGRPAACALTAALSCVCATAPAQQSDPPRLEEIIVTAQKRAESLMDVPISMTAITSEDIEKYRIQKVEDFLLVTPGVQYVETSDFLKSVSIRGINGSLGGLFQTTGVTIDDATLVATYNGFLLTSRLFDVERIEVLRGPQGALTGSHSTSGTINIITKKPDLENFGAEATLDYGRFDTRIARGVVNLPVADTFGVRMVGYVENSDGSLRNAGPAGGGSTEDHVGGRLAARWQPMDALTIDAAFSMERQKFGAPNALTIDAPGFEDAANDGAFWAETYRLNVGTLRALGGSYEDSDFIEQVGLNGGRIHSDLREKTEHELWSGSLRADYAMDRHNVALLYTRYEHDVFTLFDEDKSEFALVSSSWDGGPRSNYAELRIGSSYGGPFNWVAGFSYMKERRVLDLSFDVTEAFLPAYFGVGELADVDLNNLQYFKDYWERTLEQIESRAIFANAFWDITDRLHLSAGARVSVVDTATQSQFDTTGAFTPFNDQVRADETQFDPRVALNFDLTEEVMTYVQFATGYRSGYGNTGPAVELGIGPAQVDGEKLRNYEIGLKGHFFDRRVTLAAAAFHMDYSGMQVNRIVPVAGSGSIVEVDFDDNVNDAVARGFEAEGSWLALDGLAFSAGVSYVDSTIDAIESDGVIYRDVEFPQVSPWTVDASLEYTRPVFNDRSAIFRTEYHYRDGYEVFFPYLDTGDIGDIPPYHVVDMSLGLDSGRWSAMAYMENVFDETHWQDSFNFLSTRGAVVPYNARSYGIRVTLKFGEGR